MLTIDNISAKNLTFSMLVSRLFSLEYEFGESQSDMFELSPKYTSPIT